MMLIGWIALTVGMLVEIGVAGFLIVRSDELKSRERRVEKAEQKCAVCLTGGDPTDFLRSDHQWCNLHRAQFQHISDMEEKMRRQNRELR